MFKPEILNTLKKYSSKTFLNDLTAGIIVGIVALPTCLSKSSWSEISRLIKGFELMGWMPPPAGIGL